MNRDSNSNIAKCPTQEMLLQLVEGSGCESAELEQHLTVCERCIKALDELSTSALLDGFRSNDRSSIDRSWLELADRPNDLGKIGDWHVEQEIGRGGTGIVYRAFDAELNRHVAIKVLANDLRGTSLERFARESRAAAQLQSDYLVPIHSTGRTTDGRPILVMPLIEGQSLKKRIGHGWIKFETTARYIGEIATALDAVHEAGLIHRDVKPGNILIDRKDGRAKLTDFGLVHSAELDTLTQLDVLCGTPEYMSPEQSAGEEILDQTSDVYSLGVTFYECLTGTPPFRGSPLQIMAGHRESPPVPPTQLNPDVPRDLETICLRALSKSASKRFQSAKAMADDLNRFLTGRPINARPISANERFWLWCQRNTALALSIAGMLFVLLAGTTGTTLMWLHSQANASSYQNAAVELKKSRRKLRLSVAKFQNRIFSDEALHLQMGRCLRTELFQDVLGYLDEFCKLEPSRLSGELGQDEIAEDYLVIATAAFSVGSLEESRIASDRAIKRLEQILAQQPSIGSNFEDWHQMAMAANMKLRSLSDDTTVATKESLIALAKKYSNLLTESRPDEYRSQLVKLEVEILELEADSELDVVKLKELYRRVKSVTDTLVADETPPSDERYPVVKLLQRRAIELQIEVGSTILHHSTDVDRSGLIAELHNSNGFLAQVLKVFGLPLDVHHANAAELARVSANDQKQAGDASSALETSAAAEEKIIRAINISPQNKRWRELAAEIQLEQSHWLEEAGDVSRSRGQTNAAIMNFIAIVEADPKDEGNRIRQIQAFARFGDLSLQMDDLDGAQRGYYVGCQECNNLRNSPRYQVSAFRMKIWLLNHSIAALKASGNTEKIEQIVALQSNLLQSIASEINVDKLAEEVKAQLIASAFKGEPISVQPHFEILE